MKTKNKTKKDFNSDDSSDTNESLLAQYLKEIDKFKLLSREEEEGLVKRTFYGDEDARRELIQANLRFVVNIAKNYQKNGLPLIDLINEGNIGLIYATEKFDYRKGYHFISYAVWWVRQSILKAISEKTRPIRLPLNRANQLIKIERLKEEIVQKNGREGLSIREIAKELNLKEKDVHNIISASKETIPMDATVKALGDDEKPLLDVLEDTKFKSPEQEAIECDLKRVMREVVGTLPRKERRVITLRFGLGKEGPMSLKEVGEKLNLTKERIRQVEKRAIQRLRHPSRSVMLKIFLFD